MPTWRNTLSLAICMCAGCRVPGVPGGAVSDAKRTPAERSVPIENTVPSPPSAVQPASFSELVDEAPAPPAELRPPQTGQAPEAIPAPAPVELAPNDLTLPDLEQMAWVNNPTLAEASAKVEAARGRWVQGGLPPNIIVGYSGQQLGSRGLAEQQGVYLEQEFVRLRKLEWNKAVAAGEMQVAQRQWEAQRLRVSTDVRLGYYEVLVAQRRVELSEHLVRIARESVETSEAALRALQVDETDVLRANLEVQTTQLALQNSQNAYRAAWQRLAAVVGVPGLPCRPLTGELDAQAPEIDCRAALDRLLAESPELGAVVADVDRARSAVTRAEVEPLPDVNVQGIVQQDNATGASNGNLQVSLPIPWLNRNQGGVREARANLVASQQSVGRVQLALQQRLAGVYQRYANARNQVAAYSRTGGILENASRNLDLVRSAYEGGQLSYIDLLTAQRTNAQTNLAYLEALGELWSSVVEIEGLLLRNSLQSGEQAEAVPAAALRPF